MAMDMTLTVMAASIACRPTSAPPRWTCRASGSASPAPRRLRPTPVRGRTVLLGGRRVLTCLTLTAAARGAPITTVEGLAGEDGPLHPMQQAFLDHDAYQCGY